MRALVVAPQPFFSPRGTPLSVYYRTLVLSELGVEMDLLTYGQGEDVDIPNVRIRRIPGFRFLGLVPVGPSLLKLFLDGFILMSTVGLLLRKRYDFVHAHEESVFFCRFLKPLFRFKLVYDMHSSLPQQLTNFGYTNSRLVIGLFQKLEDFALAHADAVITISPALAEYALARVPNPDHHFLIENSIFDPVNLARKPTLDVSERWLAQIPEDRIVVCYAGTFEGYQGLDLLIRALAIAKQRRPELFLLLAGGTPKQVELYRGLARDEGVENDCLFCGTVPQSEVGKLLERADVLVSCRSRGTNTPLKVYELLASGKPFVATRIASHTQVLSEEVCFLADPRPDAMAQAIEAAARGDTGVERIVAAARAFYDEHYSRQAYAGKMKRLLEILR